MIKKTHLFGVDLSNSKNLDYEFREILYNNRFDLKNIKNLLEVNYLESLENDEVASKVMRVFEDIINENKENYIVKIKKYEDFDLNHIQGYKQFSDKVNFKGQMIKVREEFKEFSDEVYKNDYDLDIRAVIDEGLDLIVATFNLISKLGLSQDDIEVHKKKLEGYKNSGKY